MVNNLIKNSRNLLFRRQSNILSAAVVLMIMVLASRILGFIRNRLLAGSFFFPGSEWQLDVYFAAFRIPDMLFQLLVMGALSAAFIPIFSRLLDSNTKKAWGLASTAINTGFLVFLFLSLVIFIWTPQFCGLIAPNFSFRELSLMVSLTRLMLLAQMFFIVSSFLSGIIQSHQRFLIPALAPIAYNLGIILGIIFLTPYVGIYGPTIGVVLGAFLHFVIQLPLLFHLGFKYQPVLLFKDAFVKKMFKLMLPQTFNLAVLQFPPSAVVFIATSLTAGSLSIFNFAQQLNDLPIGLFGLTIGQAALPVLSVEANRDIRQFEKTLTACLRQILYLALPFSVLFLVLRIPIVRLAFGAKTFPWEATLATGKVLALFSISIFAQATTQILIRAFYAFHNTKTPFFISIAYVFVYVALAFWLTFGLKMEIFGLALAVSISSIFQMVCLVIFLQKKIPFVRKPSFYIPVGKIFLATFLTGLALWFPMKFIDSFVLDTTKTINLLFLTIITTMCGLGVYLFFSYIFKLDELGKFLQLIRRFGAWKEVLSSSEEVFDGTQTTSSSLSGEV